MAYHETSETLGHFVKYSAWENERERKKMADWIEAWTPIPLETSNLDDHYTKLINQFIQDPKINSLLEYQPSVREDIIKELVDLLQQADKAFQKDYIDHPEKNLLEQFKKHKKWSDRQMLALIKKSKYATKTSWEKQQTLGLEEAYQVAQKKAYKQLHQTIKKNWEEVLGSAPFLIKNIPQKLKETTLKQTFDDLTPEEFQASWSKDNNVYQQFLKQYYTRDQIDINGHNAAFQAIAQGRDTVTLDLSTTYVAIAQEWQDHIYEECLRKRLDAIDRLRQAALQKLYEKIKTIEELLRQLEPFLGSDGVPGRLWDLSLGNWKRVDMRTLQEYAQLLEQRKDLAELAALLGRFRQAETALEMETFEETVYYHQEHIDYTGVSELVGVVESDELSRLLPSEWALFSDEATDSIFYKRFLEKRLQTFEYISRVSQEYEQQAQQQRQKKVEEDKGPFILAVDTSGSMHGEPEFIAKVLAFAIAKMALREQRKAYLISFSRTIETLDLSQLQQALPELIRFLQLSFHGGTDAAPAVQEAIQQMKTGQYQKADLLLVSDGIFSALSTTVQQEVEQLKKTGNRFHALMIGCSYHQQALEFCDQVWQYNPRQDQLLDLVHIMQQSLAPVREQNNG